MSIPNGMFSRENIGSFPLVPNSPFSCGPEFYFTIGPGELSVLDPNNLGGGLQLLFALPDNVNATGYNPVDNYIYAIGKGSMDGHPLRIHSDGTVEDLGDIGLTLTPVTGGFTPDGLWYVKEGNTQEVAIIDLNTLTFTVTDPGSLFDGKDWAYHYGKDKFYGAHEEILYSYDPVANAVESFPVTGFLPENGVTFGAAFYSDDGFIYVLNNLSGYLYRIDVETQEAFFVHAGPTGLTSVDGCACPYSPPPFPVVYAEPDTFCLDVTGTQSYFIHDNDEVNIANLDFNTFTVILPPMYGTIDYNSSTGELTYTATGSPQEDSLVYEICCDGPAVTCDQATIYIEAPVTASFSPFGPYCAGDIPDDLPGTSNEGISGDWFPDIISTDFPGMYDYEFTPDPFLHDCALPTTITIEVLPAEIPSFILSGPYCTGENPDVLPSFSQEGILGQWFPALIDTGVPGNQVYTFTPDPVLHPCGVEVDLTISVIESATPYFDMPVDLCQHNAPIVLPAVSDDGVAGSWFPPVIHTDDPGTYEYTFTPDENIFPCAEEVVLAIEINPEEIPGFSIPSSYCTGETPNVLPDISLEGISGTWNPAVVQTDNPGDVVYTFTPDPEIHPCGRIFDLTVSVLDQIEPSFSLPTNLCQYDTVQDLPGVSQEGVSGSWEPAVIPTDVFGSFSFTFTPDPAQYPCAEPVQMTIFIEQTVQPEFDALGPFCQYDAVPSLPDGSNNGIAGSWSPDTILTNVPGNHTFIFTPDPFLHPCVPADTLEMLVSGQVQGSFSLVTEFCQGESPELLPGTSLEGITGNWFPAMISTDQPGTGIYTFTPDPLLYPCGIPSATEVTVHPKMEIEVANQECAEDLNSYDLEILITGGTAPFWIETVPVYPVTQLDDTHFEIVNIPAGTGVEIYVADDPGCTSGLIAPPHYCDCPEILPPSGAENAIICFGESPAALQVDDPGVGYAIQWYSHDSLYLANGAVFLPDSAGTYYAEIVDLVNQCTSDWVALDLEENPELIVGGYSAVCSGSSGPYTLEIMITGGTPGYELNAGGLNFVQTDPNTFIIASVPDQNGWNIQVSDGLGCTSNAFIQPEILPVPEADAGPDQVIDCFDGIAVLEGFTGEPDSCDLSWTGPDPSFSSSALNPQVEQSGIYLFTVTDRRTGCRSTDSVSIFDPEYPSFDVVIEPVRCHGEANGEVEFIATEGGLEPFLFSIDNGENYYTAGFFGELGPGDYTLVVQDARGCEAVLQVYLEEPGPIEIYLDADLLIQAGDQTQIEVETNLNEGATGSILWSPPSGLNCTDCLEPVAAPVTDTEYILTLTDTSGCLQTASVLIRVEESTGIHIPNVFSPNGDQVNEYFFIQAGEGIEEIEFLRIFHRWGHLVFESVHQRPNDPYAGWDGRFRGQLLSPEVFTYFAQIRKKNGDKIVVHGDVTLLR